MSLLPIPVLEPTKKKEGRLTMPHSMPTIRTQQGDKSATSQSHSKRQFNSSFVGLLRLYLMSTCIIFLSGCADPVWAEQGFATYYTTKSCQREGTSGTRTANGEFYLEDRLTCALPHRDFHGVYRVTSLKTGKSVIVRHNDLGPGLGARRRGVVIDLTPASYLVLGHRLSEGKIAVNVERIS